MSGLWCLFLFVLFAGATTSSTKSYTQLVQAPSLRAPKYPLCNGTYVRTFKCIKPGPFPEPNIRQCTCIGFLLACCGASEGHDSSTTTSTTMTGTHTPTPTSPTTTTESSPTEKPSHIKPLKPDPTIFPSDPLNEEEIKTTVEVIKFYGVRGQETFFFYQISLLEPSKSIVLPFYLNDTEPPVGFVPRRSLSILRHNDEATSVYEVVVNLNTAEIENQTRIENVQAMYSQKELRDARDVVISHPEVQSRAYALGYPDASLMEVEPWSYDRFGVRNNTYPGKRVVLLYLYGRNYPDDNQYAHPFNFVVIVDLIAKTVLDIQNIPGNTTPLDEYNYDYRLIPGGEIFLRKDVKPIKVDSPQGPSFKVNGTKLEWQKWKMRVGFNGREGLVIHWLSYNDNGTYRPIWYRGSISEVLTIYGDPHPPYNQKVMFDMGEFGLGNLADEQKSGEDVIGAHHFWDAMVNDNDKVVRLKSAISVREEDAGVLWKHVEFRDDATLMTRSHRLVLSYTATVASYEYIFEWAFYQDGSIQCQVQLTGIPSASIIFPPGSRSRHGSTVTSQLYSQYHQHIFAARIDPEIDGNLNSVLLSEVIPVPDPSGSRDNPYGNGFIADTTFFPTSGTARTDTSRDTARVWVIMNESLDHPYTKIAKRWKLMPQNTPEPIISSDSPLLQEQAKFVNYDFWAQPYIGERHIYPAGYYLNGSGLGQWVEKNYNADIGNTDIVFFHVFNAVHIPRIEDFPVMPTENVGFWFKPYSFFLENPSVDVPPASVMMNRKSRTEL